MTGNSSRPRILGVTLARGGSKGVPRKNIRALLGVPLLAYTVVEAKRSKHITRYIVSTDDEDIWRVAMQYGAEGPFFRPAHLASDSATSGAALQHAVGWIENQEGKEYDYVVDLPCTNPMRTSEDIDAALEKLMATGADSVIGVMQLEDHHPLRIKKIVDDRIVDFCLPEPNEGLRQNLKPDAYLRNGSIYSVRREVLMVQGYRYGTANSRPYIFPSDRTVNIDSETDFWIAELMMQRFPRDYVRPIQPSAGVSLVPPARED